MKYSNYRCFLYSFALSLVFSFNSFVFAGGDDRDLEVIDQLDEILANEPIVDKKIKPTIKKNAKIKNDVFFNEDNFIIDNGKVFTIDANSGSVKLQGEVKEVDKKVTKNSKTKITKNKHKSNKDKIKQQRKRKISAKHKKKFAKLKKFKKALKKRLKYKNSYSNGKLITRKSTRIVVGTGSEHDN